MNIYVIEPDQPSRWSQVPKKLQHVMIILLTILSVSTVTVGVAEAAVQGGDWSSFIDQVKTKDDVDPSKFVSEKQWNAAGLEDQKNAIVPYFGTEGSVASLGSPKFAVMLATMYKWRLYKTINSSTGSAIASIGGIGRVIPGLILLAILFLSLIMGKIYGFAFTFLNNINLFEYLSIGNTSKLPDALSWAQPIVDAYRAFGSIFNAVLLILMIYVFAKAVFGVGGSRGGILAKGMGNIFVRSFAMVGLPLMIGGLLTSFGNQLSQISGFNDAGNGSRIAGYIVDDSSWIKASMAYDALHWSDSDASKKSNNYWDELLWPVNTGSGQNAKVPTAASDIGYDSATGLQVGSKILDSKSIPLTSDFVQSLNSGSPYTGNDSSGMQLVSQWMTGDVSTFDDVSVPKVGKDDGDKKVLSYVALEEDNKMADLFQLNLSDNGAKLVKTTKAFGVKLNGVSFQNSVFASSSGVSALFRFLELAISMGATMIVEAFMLAAIFLSIMKTIARLIGEVALAASMGSLAHMVAAFGVLALMLLSVITAMMVALAARSVGDIAGGLSSELINVIGGSGPSQELGYSIGTIAASGLGVYFLIHLRNGIMSAITKALNHMLDALGQTRAFGSRYMASTANDVLQKTSSELSRSNNNAEKSVGDARALRNSALKSGLGNVWANRESGDNPSGQNALSDFAAGAQSGFNDEHASQNAAHAAANDPTTGYGSGLNGLINKLQSKRSDSESDSKAQNNALDNAEKATREQAAAEQEVATAKAKQEQLTAAGVTDRAQLAKAQQDLTNAQDRLDRADKKVGRAQNDLAAAGLDTVTPAQRQDLQKQATAEKNNLQLAKDAQASAQAAVESAEANGASAAEKAELGANLSKANANLAAQQEKSDRATALAESGDPVQMAKGFSAYDQSKQAQQTAEMNQQAMEQTGGVDATELNQMRKLSKQQLNQAEQRVQQSSANLAAQEAKLDQLQAAGSVTPDQLAQQQSRVDAAQNVLAGAEQQANQAKQAMQTQEQQLAQMQVDGRSTPSQISAQKKQVAAARSQVDSADNAVTEATGDLRAQQQSLIRLQNDQSASPQELKAQQARVATAQNEVSQAQAVRAEARQTASQLQMAADGQAALVQARNQQTAIPQQREQVQQLTQALSQNGVLSAQQNKQLSAIASDQAKTATQQVSVLQSGVKQAQANIQRAIASGATTGEVQQLRQVAASAQTAADNAGTVAKQAQTRSRMINAGAKQGSLSVSDVQSLDQQAIKQMQTAQVVQTQVQQRMAANGGSAQQLFSQVASHNGAQVETLRQSAMAAKTNVIQAQSSLVQTKAAFESGTAGISEQSVKVAETRLEAAQQAAAQTQRSYRQAQAQHTQVKAVVDHVAQNKDVQAQTLTQAAKQVEQRRQVMQRTIATHGLTKDSLQQNIVQAQQKRESVNSLPGHVKADRVAKNAYRYGKVQKQIQTDSELNRLDRNDR